jgi:aminoglycoside 6-adenylyltransferase
VRSEHEVLTLLLHWADDSENIRALILNGSRGDPSRKPDQLSDYDAAVFVRDLRPITDDRWLGHFGDIIVRWPLTPQQTLGPGWITQLALFDDGVRIDFQFTTPRTSTVEQAAPFHCVVIDKDQFTESLSGLPVEGTTIEPPTASEFSDRINAFWWDIPYVAKALARGEIDYAKFSLDTDIRLHKVHPLLRWYIGMKHGPDTDVGIHGRWFRRYLDDATWSAYLNTFSGGQIDDQWRAMFAMTSLVRTIATELADHYQTEYPDQTDAQVSAYLHTILEMQSL